MRVLCWLLRLQLSLSLVPSLPGRILRSRVQRRVIRNQLDRGFVADVAAAASPSVVLVLPRGVRNTTAQGSGFAVAVDETTMLLTSAHVAAGGMSVQVSLPGDNFSTIHNATVYGRAPGGEDLALLELEPTVAAQLTPMELGDADALRLGDFVIALGHPGGLRSAVTLGVLSGRSSLPAFSVLQDPSAQSEEAGEPSESLVPFLVTDAAFAGGMSGGPLLNADGAVVGVNTLVRPELRGLGNYAIDSVRVREAVQAIVTARANVAGGVKCIRVLLFNDNFNRRQRVETVLRGVGLSEAEARKAMMDAHTTGRGVVRLFEAPGENENLGDDAAAQAEALREELAAADLLVELQLTR